MCAASSARAQSKSGAVEVSLTPGVPGPAAPLTPNSVPQLVTLNLAAPSLALTPGIVAAPAAAAKPAAPLALTGTALPAAAAPLPPLPASAVAPEAVAGRPVSLDKAGAPEDLGSDAEKTSIAEQLEKTRALFGESRGRAGLSIDEERPSVILPLPGAEALPETIVVRGETFRRKKELHATIVGTRDKHPLAALKKAAIGGLPVVRLRDEYRLVRKDGKSSLIQLADVDGLDAYYARLEDALGKPRGSIPRPPGHVTLYTSGDENGRGIGIYTDAELAALSEPVTLSFADATKRLFSPTDQPGVMSSKYLRLDEPFEFGSSEVFRYRTALDAYGAKDGGEATETLLNAAEALAASAGIKTERGERTLPDGTVRPVLRIVPQLRGHRLNRLAWDLARGYGAGVEYSPERTRGGTAAFNGLDNVLFLPDFGSEKAFEAILHESRHAAFAKRLRNGDISVFHGSLLAYAGRDIAPGAESYDKYMSLEELSTHAKTLLHTIIRAQRGDGDEAVWKATSYAFQLIDVLRSAEINLFQLQRKLEKGEAAFSRVEGSPTFRDFKGGHWEVINLPHAMFVLPVPDEAPAPKRKLLDRLFKAKPETAAARAARRHVEALRPMIASLGEELETFLGALRGENRDLAKARASASRMTSLAAKAEEKFAASK